MLLAGERAAALFITHPHNPCSMLWRSWAWRVWVPIRNHIGLWTLKAAQLQVQIRTLCVNFGSDFLLPCRALHCVRLALCCSCASMVQRLGRFLGIIRRHPSVSKFNQLHVDVFRFFCIWIWGIFSKVIGGFPQVWNFNRLFPKLNRFICD